MMFAATNADAETANPSDATVTVNGAPVQMAAYNLYGSNYFKLRDVAAALNGTEKQFSVDWLASYQYIILDSGKVMIQQMNYMNHRRFLMPNIMYRQ